MKPKLRACWALGTILLALGLVVVSVPVYRLVLGTGHGAATRRGQATRRAATADRIITVRFDATTAPDLDWQFRPLRPSVKVHPGETRTVAFRAVNRGDTATTGTATIDVTPKKAGIYFDKLECFCFTRQHLAPDQGKDLAVTFLVDPDIVNDPNDANVSTITLSYTMFRVQTKGGRGQTAAVFTGSPTLYR